MTPRRRCVATALVGACIATFAGCDASGGRPTIDDSASTIIEQTSTTLRSSSPAVEEIRPAVDLAGALVTPTDVGFGDVASTTWRAYQPSGACGSIPPPSTFPTLDAAGQSVIDTETGDDLVVSQVARFASADEARSFVDVTRTWIDACPDESRPIDERATLSLRSATGAIDALGDGSFGASIAVSLLIDGVPDGSGASNAVVYAHQGNLAVVIRLTTVDGSVEQAASLARLVLSRLATT